MTAIRELARLLFLDIYDRATGVGCYAKDPGTQGPAPTIQGELT